MARKTGNPPHHNTITCYVNYGCRLPACVTRYNIRNQERLRAQKNGTWNQFVDAEPVRRHIHALQAAGRTPAGIAAAVGVAPRAIHDFISGRPTLGLGKRQRTNPDLARRILALTPDDIRTQYADPTGTLRRAQALIAIGWPQERIARHAGLGDAYLTGLAGQTYISPRSAAAISRAYNELRHMRPRRHGVTKQQYARCRALAAANRWPDPTYWDEYADCIDDPDFEPMYKVPRVEQIAAEARWLLDGGESREHVARSLGATWDYVDKSIRETGRQGLTA